MDPNRANWTDGKVLQSPCFQASKRHLNSVTSIAGDWLAPCGCGLEPLEFSEDAIVSSQFDINAFEARTHVVSVFADNPNFADNTKTAVDNYKLVEHTGFGNLARIIFQVVRLKASADSVEGDQAPLLAKVVSFSETWAKARLAPDYLPNYVSPFVLALSEKKGRV